MYSFYKNKDKSNKCISIIKELDTKNIIKITNTSFAERANKQGLGFEFNHILKVYIYSNNTLDIELIYDNYFIFDDDSEYEDDNNELLGYFNELECLLNKNINKVINILSFIRDNKEVLIKRILDLVLEK